MGWSFALRFPMRLGFPGGSDSEASACNARDLASIPGSGRFPGEGKGGNPTWLVLPGKCHGQRSLVGYSPWGRKESDMTEQLHFHFPYEIMGKGNCLPLGVASGPNWVPCQILHDTRPSTCAPKPNTGFSNWPLLGREVVSPSVRNWGWVGMIGAAAAAAKSLQSCPTLCDPIDVKVKSEREVAQSCPTVRDPMDCSLPGSPVHGIFQARVQASNFIFFKCWEACSLYWCKQEVPNYSKERK